MTTFERFIEAIGDKDELEPFKFHLLQEPISLLDQYGHFHAAWALAWIRKNDNSGDHIAYAMCATPFGSEVGITVLQKNARQVREHSWEDFEAKLLPWVRQWFQNVPRPLLVKGGYIAAGAKKPCVCDYCHIAVVQAARYLYRAAGKPSRKQSCERTDCKMSARLETAQTNNIPLWEVLETEIDPFK